MLLLLMLFLTVDIVTADVVVVAVDALLSLTKSSAETKQLSHSSEIILWKKRSGKRQAFDCTSTGFSTLSKKRALLLQVNRHTGTLTRFARRCIHGFGIFNLSLKSLDL